MDLVAIGFVRSPIQDPTDAPRQGRDAGTEVDIQILPAFADALDGLDAIARVIVVCWMHRARRDRLRMVRRSEPGSAPVGVFATRTPHRPNPLAVYTADLLGRSGATLRVRGVDAVDGTPVVDLRPFVPRLDA